MATVFIPRTTSFTYVYTMDACTIHKQTRVIYNDNIHLNNVILEIVLGENGNNVFLVGLTPVEMNNFKSENYQAKNMCEFQIPSGIPVIPETGIATLLIEPLTLRLEKDQILCLAPDTVLYDRSSGADLVLKKRCNVKVRGIQIRK